MKIEDINSEIKDLVNPKIQSIISDMVDFVRDIKPVLDSINKSIDDNLKKMPSATDKLEKVSQATEVATTEILNVVDGIFAKTDSIQKNMKKISLDFDSLKDISDDTIKLSNGINDDATSIMMALQVQDITSQQIAAVNHLLEIIQQRLSAIIMQYNLSEIKEIIKADGEIDKESMNKLHKKIAFDPDAINAIYSKEDRQSKVDEIIGQVSEINSAGGEEMSDDDIAKLFGNQSDESKPADDDSEMSADDIAKLFGG